MDLSVDKKVVTEKNFVYSIRSYKYNIQGVSEFPDKICRIYSWVQNKSKCRIYSVQIAHHYPCSHNFVLYKLFFILKTIEPIGYSKRIFF